MATRHAGTARHVGRSRTHTLESHELEPRAESPSGMKARRNGLRNGVRGPLSTGPNKDRPSRIKPRKRGLGGRLRGSKCRSSRRWGGAPTQHGGAGRHVAGLRQAVGGREVIAGGRRLGSLARWRLDLRGALPGGGPGIARPRRRRPFCFPAARSRALRRHRADSRPLCPWRAGR
jgi:hypothetical protein